MEKISVRWARKSDMEFILVALGDVARSSRQRLKNRDALARRLRKECFGARARGRILIASSGGRGVGLLLYGHSYFASSGEALWVSQLYVIKEMRGKGVAGKLWKALAALNRRATYAHWVADIKNKGAQKHFRKLGAKHGKYLYFYNKL